MKLTTLLGAASAVAMNLGVMLAADPAPRVGLKLVADGFMSPLSYVPLPDSRALVVDQEGLLKLLGRDGQLAAQPVFDIRNRLSPVSVGHFDERGFLDLALHPKFAENRRVFVTYTAPKSAATPADWDCIVRLSEFKLPAGEPLAVDPSSERVLLEVSKPFNNHNGARLVFGPDGLLYMSLGDGGNANDDGKRPASGNSQNLWSYLGKILRIDIDMEKDGKPYSIPPSNPFADGKQALPEIYAYGLRNPWGLSFDRGGTHEFFAADVGQNLYEEVDIIVKGGNYGWNLREGLQGFDPKAPNTPPAGVKVGARGEPLIDPVMVYPHPTVRKGSPAFGISITGGYVYRGRALPELSGSYVFGDWSQNWGLPQGVLFAGRRPSDGTKWTVDPIEIESTPKFSAYITGFGQDNDGELYVLTNGSNSLVPGKGRIYKIVPAK